MKILRYETPVDAFGEEQSDAEAGYLPKALSAFPKNGISNAAWLPEKVSLKKLGQNFCHKYLGGFVR